MRPGKGPLTEAQLQAAWTRYEAVWQSLKDVAAQRLAALQAVDKLVISGRSLMDARASVAAQMQRDGMRGGSVASLGRWAADVAQADKQHRLALLVPGYVGRTVTADIPHAAWDAFKADYLRVEAPTATSCYERVQRRAKAERWALPSLRAFQSKLQRELPAQVLRLARHGVGSLDLMYPAQERDRSGFAALEAVNADGHKFDVFVRFPSGKVARPVMVGVQDLYSGKLLGWRLAETESADLARLAFRDVIERFGIMSDAWLDNGRGFASKMLTGGTATRFRFKVKPEEPTGALVAIGVNIHWTTPYNGQAKPIERAWRDLCDRIAKHPAFAGAYTGNKPDNKPENHGSRAIPLAEFTRIVGEEITAHNARPGRRSKVCNGSSFDAIFNESYTRTTIRRATEEQLRQMLMAAELVGANPRDGSVRLLGNRYWCAALAQHCGRRLMVRFDPDALHTSVQVYTAAHVFVGTADCIAAVGFADSQAAREHARAKTKHRRATRQQLDAECRMDVAKVAELLPRVEPETRPSATIIAPLFGRPRGAPVVSDATPVAGRDQARDARFQDLMARLAQSNAQPGLFPEDEG